MNKSGFLRCYIEGWVFWLGLNIIAGLGGLASHAIFGVPDFTVADFLDIFDPSKLLIQAVFVVPVIAMYLVGKRSTPKPIN